MKKIIYIILMAFSLSATAQTHILTSATGSFIIDDKQFPLNSMALYLYPYDTTLIGIVTADNQRFQCITTSYSNYILNGIAATNRTAINNFFNSYMISSGGGGSGTVTTVTVTTANGISGTVLNPNTAPAITLAIGAITPTSVNASGTISGSNFSGTSSGTNTGDQTSITGNAGTATALQTARNINGVSFNGTANIAVPNSTVISDVASGAVTWTTSGTQNLTKTTTITPTGVTAGTTGSSSAIPVITYNAAGQITAISTATIGSGSSGVTSITAGTGLSGGTITTSGTISMPNVGTAGTYGSITTDAQGRVASGKVVYTFDTLALTGTTNDTVRNYLVTVTGDYTFSAYCNITTFSTAVTFKMNITDETGTQALRTGAWRPLTNTATFVVSPNSQAYWMQVPYTIRIQAGSTISVIINPGSGTTLNGGFVLKQED